MDTIVEATREAKRWIEQLEPKERARLGIKNDKGLRVDYNKVFGYYIEVSNSYADSHPSRLYPQADGGNRRALFHRRAERV